jgi:hypothetical protein
MPPIGNLPEPAAATPRYASRPFPAYRYVPGVHPHPTRDARGHSYDPTPTLNRHPAWHPDEWRTLEAWLYGVDLFNAHYFWEAHEAWEGLWAAVPRDSVPALLLQGLIQLAAALLKLHLGSEYGVLVLSREGLDKLRHVAEVAPQFMGLEVGEVTAAYERYFEPTSRGATLALTDVPVLRLRGAGDRAA